jgi:hypothetical protein
MPLASRAGCAWCVRLRGLKTNTHPFIWYTRALFRCFDFWKMNPTHHAHHAQTTKTLPFCTIICTFAAPLATVADVREHRDNVLGLLRTSWTTAPPWSKAFPMGCCLANGQPKTMLGEPPPTHCSRCSRRWAFPCGWFGERELPNQASS